MPRAEQLDRLQEKNQTNVTLPYYNMQLQFGRLYEVLATRHCNMLIYINSQLRSKSTRFSTFINLV